MITYKLNQILPIMKPQIKQNSCMRILSQISARTILTQYIVISVVIRIQLTNLFSCITVEYLCDNDNVYW